MSRPSRPVLALFALLALGPGPAAHGAARAAVAPAADTPHRQVRFTFTDAVSATPVSGRLVLGFQRDPTRAVGGPDLFDPQPFFAWDVHDWRPGEPLSLDATNAERWRDQLDSLRGWYAVQAVLRSDPRTRGLEAPGNAFSARSVVYLEPGDECRPLDLLLAEVAPPRRRLAETESVRYVTVPSRLLAAFYGEPDSLVAAVVLPRSYATDTTRLYPTVYVFGGFGSSLADVASGTTLRRYGLLRPGEEKVCVVVHHECRSGYHVFCDSPTNGPRERTFFEELLPFLEAHYRVRREPDLRFLMGQSSGAWAGLWLLLNYPDRFGGAYVGAPDPVDFTDFIGTDLYRPGANLYVDAAGREKSLPPGPGPGERAGTITIRDLVALDRIIGWGEQMRSFDATFGPRGADGRPRPLFDWASGRVDPIVAAAWRRHDLSRVVAGLDHRRAAALQGKIHVYVAEDDNFGLNRPVHSFERALRTARIAADIHYLPRGGHIVWSDSLRTMIHDDMDARIRARTARGPAHTAS